MNKFEKEEIIMPANQMFRTVIFGGLNKEDVEEYIKTLEHEIESIKVLHQKEKNDWMKKMSEGQYENQESDEELKKIQEINRQLSAENNSLRNENISLKDEIQNRDLKEQVQREISSEFMGDGNDYTKKISEEKYKALLDENAHLENKINELEKQMQESKQNEKNINKEKGKGDFFDYDTVTKIMEEARKNAEQIEAEGRKKAEKIIEEAKTEAEKQKEIVLRRINGELEEKGIQLIAAKYKIEQYAKELNNAQQGLYNLNFRIKEMAEKMPVRLDDYWDGEHYQMLVNKKNKIKIEQKESLSTE